MSEIYWGCYRVDKTGIMCGDGTEIVSKPDDIDLPTKGTWYGVGSGWLTYADKLTLNLGKAVQGYQGKRYPQARAMIPLALAAFQAGQVVDAEDALPVYLRNKVVKQ